VRPVDLSSLWRADGDRRTFTAGRVIDEILRHLEAHSPEDPFRARDPPPA
jgi:hypothetical protein